MSLDTFMAISPAEFSEVYERWLEYERIKRQERWNMARWVVFKTLCPPEKKKICMLDIERFEWDPKDSGEKRDVPVSTKERFDELTRKYGKRLQAGDRNSGKRQKL